jgi:hypothetical protein
MENMMGPNSKPLPPMERIYFATNIERVAIVWNAKPCFVLNVTSVI